MSKFSKLLIFSDLHICASGETIIGLDPEVKLRQALAHATARHGDADHVVFLGDLTHHGRLEEFQLLRDILSSLDLPTTFLVGNHDRRERFLEVFGEAPTTASGHVQTSVKLGHTTLITLDTLDGPPYPAGHHSGRLCEHRLGWLEAELDRAQPGPVLLAMHHPPVETGFEGMDAIRLKDDAAFWNVIAACESPVHLLCGHVHRTISGQARGVPFTILKSTCHQMPMTLQRSSSGSSVDEPGAYGIALLHRDQIILHTEDFELSKVDAISRDRHST
ncbi:MAG: phosphodiesterase [Pseudomonadota bacterium]